jgi:hypothetical protein
MPAVLLLGVLPIAWLDATSERRMGLPGIGGRGRTIAGRAATAAVFVLGAIAVVTLARTESIVAAHDRVSALVDQGDWRDAERAIATVVGDDPDMTAYQVTRGLVASALGDWTTAAVAYERAAMTDDLPQSWLGLAQARLELGAPEAEVVDAIERATRVGEQQAAVDYAAAALYDRLGLTARADEAYVTALVRLPGLAADPSWHDGTLASRGDAIMSAATERLGAAGWQIPLLAGDLERAHQLAAESPDPSATLIVDAWSGDAAAVDAVVALAGASARDAVLHGWAALIADREGKTATADRFRRLALFNWEGAELPGHTFGLAPGVGLEGLEGVPAGTRFAFYGEWLYRRGTPIDLTPPGLPRPIYADIDLAADDPVDDDADAP